MLLSSWQLSAGQQGIKEPAITRRERNKTNQLRIDAKFRNQPNSTKYMIARLLQLVIFTQ
jgi:hypothetical protein